MVTAIVQARMKSSRLPGKVMREIEGRPMLWHVVKRLKKARLVGRIIIATSNREIDTPILKLGRALRLDCYAGSEQDVLDRYYRAATNFGADIIVRITADCALIDPHIVDDVIRRYMQGDCDYVANTLKWTYPDGVDVEVFSYAVLEKAWREARWASEREHVTPYIRKNPDKFRLVNIESGTDLSRFRWSVDREEDLEFVRQVFRHLYQEGQIFYMEDVLKLIEKYPQLADINRDIVANEGYQKSLREDRIVK
jgi:spore coat polysaccharide biosynthesis protein SpsF (cytidylyltransferase family)